MTDTLTSLTLEPDNIRTACIYLIEQFQNTTYDLILIAKHVHVIYVVNSEKSLSICHYHI